MSCSHQVLLALDRGAQYHGILVFQSVLPFHRIDETRTCLRFTRSSTTELWAFQSCYEVRRHFWWTSPWSCLQHGVEAHYSRILSPGFTCTLPTLSTWPLPWLVATLWRSGYGNPCALLPRSRLRLRISARSLWFRGTDIKSFVRYSLAPLTLARPVRHSSCLLPRCSSKSPRSRSTLLQSLFSLLPVSSLRDEDLTERGFGCTGPHLRELRPLARRVVCSGTRRFGGRGGWPWRALRWRVPSWPGCKHVCLLMKPERVF